jgi:type IV secretory pathway VirB2 component (pilin)
MNTQLTEAQSPRRPLGVTAYLLSCMALAEAELAHAGAGGSLSEVEDTATFVLDIFSPGLLLTLLTLLLVGCGLAVYFGRMSGSLFVKILLGSVLVFGARTIAPKLVALF